MLDGMGWDGMGQQRNRDGGDWNAVRLRRWRPDGGVEAMSTRDERNQRKGMSERKWKELEDGRGKGQKREGHEVERKVLGE